MARLSSKPSISVILLAFVAILCTNCETPSETAVASEEQPSGDESDKNDTSADVTVEFPSSIAMSGDQGYFVVGYSFNNWTEKHFRPRIIKVKTNGKQDKSFNSKALEVSESLGAEVTFIEVAVQNDGKILLVGSAMAYHNGNQYVTSEILVARLLKNGKLDSSFGSNGVVRTSLANQNTNTFSSIVYPQSLVIQSDGKILVLADNVWTRTLTSTSQSTDYDVSLVRYNSNGSLDSSFGSGGISTAKAGFSSVTWRDGQSRAGSSEMAVDSTGKIFVAGYSTHSNGPLNKIDEQYTVFGFLANGALNSAFGSNGVVRVEDQYYVTHHGRLESIAVQADGKVLVGGRVEYVTNNVRYYAAQIIRLTTSGAFDGSFGNGGVASIENTVDSWFLNTFNNIDVSSTGDITATLSGGVATANGAGTTPALIRFTSGGIADLSFGVNGRADLSNEFVLRKTINVSGYYYFLGTNRTSYGVMAAPN